MAMYGDRNSLSGGAIRRRKDQLCSENPGGVHREGNVGLGLED